MFNLTVNVDCDLGRQKAKYKVEHHYYNIASRRIYYFERIIFCTTDGV